MHPGLLTIGQVAENTNISAKAIRHYEALGLLPLVWRRGNYRYFSEAHVQAIRLIRQAQDLGFTLAELRTLSKEDCTPDWPRLLLAIEHKRRAVQDAMSSLRKRDAALAELAHALPAIMGEALTCEDLAVQLLKT